MRYIFFTLLLLNLGYFGYATFLKQPPAPPVTVTSPSRADTIYLLSENNDANAASDAQLDQVINNPVNRSDTDAHDCMAVGPFTDVFSGQALVRQLQALDMKVRLQAFDQPTGKNDYRVLIPPADSLQDAFRKLRELKSRNIDSHVITQGKYALGISLGVFADESEAKIMQANREKAGYKVEVVQIPRYNREFWVFSSQGSNLDINPQLWQSLVSEHSGLQRKEMPCLLGGDTAPANAGASGTTTPAESTNPPNG